MKPFKCKIAKITDESSYSVAPYNFVSFPQTSVSRYNNPEELPSHNSYKDKDTELLSGYIEYTLRAETPIIVSDGEEKGVARFFRNSDGKYAIPANSIRGMIRTNAQILSFSDIVGNKDEKGKYRNSYIENSRFLYRDIAGGDSLNKRYNSILSINQVTRIAKNLKSGYIHRKNGRYFIQPAMEIIEEIPYFRVDEIVLRKIGGSKIKGIEFLYERKLLDHEQELRELNKVAGNHRNSKYDKKVAKKKIQSILEKYSRERKGYKPYQIRISFDLNEKGRVNKVGNIGEYKYEGYILSGGFILGKRSHYIIPMEDDKQYRIELSEDDIMSYEDDMTATKKADIKDGKVIPKEEYEFYALPKENEIKPIFYINTNRLHFGFTPFLRLSYNKSVLDGVAENYRENPGISYADGIFGFNDRLYRTGRDMKKCSYKSRVSFEDALVHGEAMVDDESTMDIVLAEPKPNSYNLYLVQRELNKKRLAIYEDDNFRIRGYKQYWLKNYIEYPDLEEDNAVNMRVKIYPLKEGTEFKGRIYFTNLYEDELGLLLWSLKLNEGCYQNIGLAKPYGFGRVKVENIKLRVEDLSKKYSSFSFDYYIDDDINKYIELYKEYFSKNKLKGKNIEDTTPFREFMYIKSTVIEKRDSDYYRYMGLEEFKFRKVLPTILQCKNAYSMRNNSICENVSRTSNSRANKAKNKRGKKDTRKDKNRDSFGNTAMMEAFNKAQKKK